MLGSLESVKKRPGDYLSNGCDNLSDLRGKIGLVGSSLMIVKNRGMILCSGIDVCACVYVIERESRDTRYKTQRIRKLNV